MKERYVQPPIREVVEQVEEKEVRRDPFTIVEMPLKEDLEDFLRGRAGHRVTVIFNPKAGVFERIGKHEEI